MIRRHARPAPDWIDISVFDLHGCSGYHFRKAIILPVTKPSVRIRYRLGIHSGSGWKRCAEIRQPFSTGTERTAFPAGGHMNLPYNAVAELVTHDGNTGWIVPATADCTVAER